MAAGNQVRNKEDIPSKAVSLSAVKRACPTMLIELHDPVTGPSSAHYTPTYYLYTRENSFDSLWGHEFMWNSMDDLLSGRARSLYYYNLAYSIPLYLHVGLKTDNTNALVMTESLAISYAKLSNKQVHAR